MVVAPAPGEQRAVAGDHEGDSAQGRAGGSRRLRLAVVAVLALLLVVAVAAGTWGYTRWSSAEKDLDARADVVRVAEQFTVAVNNYDSGSIDQYKSTVNNLLSTKFQAQFNQAMEDIVAQVQQAKMKSTGKVLAAGVSTIDQDSAKVLVVADADVNTVYDQRKRHFRWEVSLVKVDGKWLVDDFSPVS